MITRVDETQERPLAQEYEFERSTDGSQNMPASPRSALIETPVLIVGAGPTGLLQGYLLSRLGGTSSLIAGWGHCLLTAHSQMYHH